jgi:organic radical activating enzyme
MLRQHPAKKNKNKFTDLMENKSVCLSKWRWSTIHLQQGTTRSCHRTAEDKFTVDDFDNFHNLPVKLDTRFDMLNGKWPGRGCEYCKTIEDAGGISDRLIFNRDSTNENIPKELFVNNKTIRVTPTLIEISLGNLCNMSCVYCGPAYSSVWEAEMLRYPDKEFRFDENLFTTEQYKRVIEKFFDWLDRNIEHLRDIHILGGEPTLQPEFMRLIDFFENNKKRVKLDTFVVMTNLKVTKTKLQTIASRLDRLTLLGCIKSVYMYPSIDCWGLEQEYIRTGINIKQFEENFAYLVKNYPNIQLQTHSVITALSLKTLPDLMSLVNHYNQFRTENKILTNWNFVSFYDQYHPGWFPTGFFDNDFDRVIDLIDHKDGKVIMQGLKDTANSMPYEPSWITHLKSDLDKLDNRRNTNWRKTFPWLAEFDETKER